MSPDHGRSPRSVPGSVSLGTAHSVALFQLEIARGQTAHPLRPILGDRYLIGSGDWCDLCLGGPQMPVLHSVIHRDGEQIWIDAVAPAPELTINGVVTPFGEILPGDELSIGAFQFHLRQNKQASKFTAVPSIDRVTTVPDLDELPNLSASELIDLLAGELELADELERRKQRGTEALLDALRRQQSGGQEQYAAPSRIEIAAHQQSLKQPADLMQELEAAIHSINQFAKTLEARSHQLSNREISAAATTLLKIQEQVVSRLDEVLAKVAQLPKPQVVRTPRREVA